MLCAVTLGTEDASILLVQRRGKRHILVITLKGMIEALGRFFTKYTASAPHDAPLTIKL